jgi:cytoskeleton protein RodZ
MSGVHLMSDGFNLVQSGSAEQPAVTLPVSAGSMLRQAREAAGLHVAALAVSMKVPVKKLEALEADRLDLLPDMVFVRALASSVCRSLKIDPTPILGKLPPSGLPRLGIGATGINTPFQPSGETSSLSVRSLLAKPAVLGVLALLTGAFILLFVPDMQKQESSVDVSNLPNSAQADLPAPVVSNLDDGAIALAAPISSININETPVPVPAVRETELKSVEPAITAVQTPVSVPAGVAATSQLPVSTTAVVVSPSPELISFKAKANSWVQVVDSKGGVQLSRTLVTGESVAVGGVPPLSVIVGRVDAIDVVVRGKSFSLAGIGIDNVARFEVK